MTSISQDLFNSFINRLKTAYLSPLPGAEAQTQMAPKERIERMKRFKRPNTARLSAVLILLYPIDGIPHFVLTQRPTYNGAHSGQMALPGGKHDEYDDNMVDTALRETQEELGVSPKLINIIGELTPLYIPPSNFLVHPFIGYSTVQPHFIPDNYEVAEVFDTPVEWLTDANRTAAKLIGPSTGESLKWPYYDFHQRTVWGATAMMLSEFAHLL